MYAYRLTGWEQTPRLLETETPAPQAGQVLVRVAGNGLCQSDLHLSHMPEVLVRVAGNGLCQSDLHLSHMPEELCASLGWNMPFTLGHEECRRKAPGHAIGRTRLHRQR